jgi:hypothetical protein
VGPTEHTEYTERDRSGDPRTMRKGGGAAGEATGEEEKEERERFPEKKRGAQKSPGVLGPGWETESKPDGDIELHPGGPPLADDAGAAAGDGFFHFFAGRH